MQRDGLNLKFESDAELLDFSNKAFFFSSVYFATYQSLVDDMAENFKKILDSTTSDEDRAVIKEYLREDFADTDKIRATAKFFLDLLNVLPEVPGVTYDEKWVAFCTGSQKDAF